MCIRDRITGATEVSVSELFSGVVGGVCTRVCTENSAICSTLTMQGERPDPEPWTCQVVALGSAPYPELAPAFPFNDQLDEAEQMLGRPFGAVCRPPFGLDPDVADDVCGACASQGDCGDESACVHLGALALVAQDQVGACAPSCAGSSECPSGFECLDVEGINRCIPSARTCTDCRDSDADGYGDGRCGGADRVVTPHDCDDLDPLAYFEPGSPNHPFPMYCGDHDYNCNGFSDDAEQIGAFAFPAEHCTACGDVCEGAIQDGQRGCRVREVSGVDQPACVAVCDTDASGSPTHADCDGDITNGCEVPIDDPSRIFYFDFDGDGAGDPNNPTFNCDSAGAPDGYVANADDCDDADGNNYPGNAEVCDGRDNNCVDGADEAGTVAPVSNPFQVLVNGQIAFGNGPFGAGEPCIATFRQGVCQGGALTCNNAGLLLCAQGPADQPTLEVCGDGLDNNCNGVVDEGVNAVDNVTSMGAQEYFFDSDRDGVAPMGAASELRCAASATWTQALGDCDDMDGANYPGNTEVCDGKDNNCVGGADEPGTVGALNNRFQVSVEGTFGRANATVGQTCSSNLRFGQCRPGLVACSNQAGRVFCEPGIATGSQTEACANMIDDDCDGLVDEGESNNGALTYYTDMDGDNYPPDINSPLYLCPERVASFPNLDEYTQTASPLDCDDQDGTAAPVGVLETCDRVDNDCGDGADEGCPRGDGVDFLGTDSPTNGSVTGNQNGTQTNLFCQDGYFMGGIEVYAQTGDRNSLNWIRIRCIQIRIRDSGFPNNAPSYYYEAVNATNTGSAGTINGDYGSTNCPGAGVVGKIEVSYDSPRLTSFQVTCDSKGLSTTQGDRVSTAVTQLGEVELPQLGQSKTNALISNIECFGSDEAMTGLSIWNDGWFSRDRLVGVRPRCSKMTTNIP